MTPLEACALVMMQESTDAPAWSSESQNDRARRCIAYLFLMGVLNTFEQQEAEKALTDLTGGAE